MSTTAASFQGSDWIGVASRQAAVYRQTFGVQSAVGFAETPFTPGQAALDTFNFWSGNVVPIFTAAAQEGKDIGAALSTSDGGVFDGSASFFVSTVPKTVAGTTGDMAVKQSAANIDTALRTMLDAMSLGSDPGTHNGSGLLCLDPVNSARFWGAAADCGREYSFLAADTSISTTELLSAAAEGAADGLKNVGEVAGQALAAAGAGVGDTLGGFFKGLGVVNTVVLVGGAYIVARRVI